ncbi:uncharacterized protein TRAVEDRAFT_25093 [Trametes versicolor FP-101664 SS1]|uniref:Uncharacterized protein n=1 Tax=Trametes versicolor (strain FP-101664) TaxID=717944 RepID=R7S6A2_TRAVS|nr:uncharacterized protein TRAVEDRAFT_25093 [Trametes versicolor FP-101664 SS1]EIW51403.1 hypothetical protein TRAVEDRAFT_25093 [Trametes versicolor FP-101664 SS1]
MVIELNISEWDDLPDLETVSGSDDEWEIEGVLGGGRTEVQERSAAETEAAGTLRLNSESTTAASSAVLGYTLLPSTLGSTLPDIDIDARNGRVNLRPLDGHTIRAEPAAHGPSSVATAGPVLADMQHVPQVSAEVIKALCSDFASIRLETRTRIRENGHDENMGDADWSPPLMLDGFQGHYSDRSKNSAVDDLAEGRMRNGAERGTAWHRHDEVDWTCTVPAALSGVSDVGRGGARSTQSPMCDGRAVWDLLGLRRRGGPMNIRRVRSETRDAVVCSTGMNTEIRPQADQRRHLLAAARGDPARNAITWHARTDVRQRQHQLWRPNGHGCQPRKLADRVKDVIASVATLTQGIQSRVIDDIRQLVGKPHIAIAAARLSQLCLPPSAVSPLSPAPYPLRFLDRRTMARTTQTARKSANPKGPPKKPLPAPPKKTRASTSTLAAAAPPPPVKTAPRSIPSHRSARVVAAEEAEVVQEGEQPYLEEDDEVDELLQDDDAVYDAALNDDAVFNVDENGNPMEDDDELMEDDDQLMEDDDQLMEDDDAPMEDDDAPMDDYDESTEDLEGQPLQAIHGAAESPKRHSSRPKRQPTPTTSEDEAEGEPEGEDTLMDVEINATEDEYGAAQLAEAIAGILRPAPQPEEGGLLPGGDRPMERSLRALFDNIGEGTDAFGEDTAVLAATLRNGPPRMRASSAKGKGKGKDKDNVEEVSVFDEGLDHAEIVARLQVIGVPGRGLAADEETKRLYKERQAALLGYGIVDLCDPEFLSYAIWGQYNSRTTNPNTVLALAQDFKTAGKRHWEHPLEGALDSSWVDRKTLTKDLSSLDKIPFLKLNYKAMGQHAMTFFSGAHRKVACWVCCMAATTTLESIDTEIEVGIEEGVTEDDPSMKTLRTMRDNVEKELESSGWWLVRVSNLGKVTENLAHKLSENNELQEEKMRVEERLFIWLRDIRQRVQEWRLSHPGEETPSVDSNQWRELFINPAIAHNERKGQSAVWILSSPVAYAFLQRMSTYDYFRAEGTISHNELKARLMPASRAKTEIQTVGYMWHDIAISGLNQMDFIARTTEFGTWRDDGECGEIYKSYFQLIEDGAEASWTSEDCAEIKHKFEEAVSLAATKGRLVARMWPRELLNAIDKLYVEHVAPVMGRMGTSQWDAAMHVYNKALVVTCQAVWGLPVFVEGDAQLAQSSAYALDKLLVCRRLCKTGVYLNVPLPTRSFLDESYKRLENVEYAIRWMTRTLDPRVDAVARQVGRGYIDYSHYLLYLLRDPERFPHRPGFDIALPLWGFVLKNYELLKVVEDVVWLNLARADDLFSFSPNSYRTLGEKLAKEGAAHPMPTEFATLYPGGWNNKISQLLALGRSKIAEAISNKPPAVIAYISTSEYHARLAGVAPPPPPTVRKPDTHEEVRVKIGYEEFSPALLKETPLLAALRFTDPRWCVRNPPETCLALTLRMYPLRMTRTLDPRVDAVARQVGRGYIDYSHYLLYLLRDPERFPHRPGFDIALPLWGFVLKNYELLKVVEDVVWLNLARADDLFSFSPNSYRTLGEKLAKEGAAHPMPTEFATLYPGGWNNKISQLLALGRSKIAEAISNKPPAVIAYISTSEYHARLAGVAPPPPPTVRKPDTHEEVRVKIGYEEFSPALLKETPLLAALRFTDPRWCADAQQGSNKPKWLGAIVLHINTILDIMRRWAGDVYSNPCVQLLRIKLFQFLSLHSAAKTPWKNWDSGLLGELSGIDNLDPEDTDMLAAAIKAIDAVPDVPLHVNAHGRRARGAQGIARTAADAEVSQPDDEIVFLRMEGAVDVETRRLKYKTEASRLVTSIRRMTSASAGPAQPKAIDARVVNAMQELLNALYYNVNRIEYRYSVGDIQSERPWVLPSAPFAHTLDTPALLGVVDNNAFLDLGDFKTRLPTAYTQYSAAAQGSRRNKIPPPSISQLKDGALVQTTRAWLPQDFSWDLSLKGSPSISVKMEDMDDDAVILGVPRAQSTNSAPDLMDDTEDGDLDLINNEMQDGQPERIPASAKGKAREVPAPPVKSTPVARPRAAAPRKPAKNPPAVNPPPSTKARTPKAATAPIQNQPPPALARARSAKAVVTAPAPEPVQAGNTLPVPPQRERVTRSSTTSAKGNTGPLSAAPAPVASSAKARSRTAKQATKPWMDEALNMVNAAQKAAPPPTQTFDGVVVPTLSQVHNQSGKRPRAPTVTSPSQAPRAAKFLKPAMRSAVHYEDEHIFGPVATTSAAPSGGTRKKAASAIPNGPPPRAGTSKKPPAAPIHPSVKSIPPAKVHAIMLSDEEEYGGLPVPRPRTHWTDITLHTAIDWSPTSHEWAASTSPTPCSGRLHPRLPVLNTPPMTSGCSERHGEEGSVAGPPSPSDDKLAAIPMVVDVPPAQPYSSDLRTLLTQLDVYRTEYGDREEVHYRARADAFLGCALVDLNDDDFLAHAAWGVYDDRKYPQDVEVSRLALQFAEVGRQHAYFPLDAALDPSWIENGSILTHMNGLGGSIPLLRLHYDAMGMHRVQFFNGSNRRKACQVYAAYFRVRQRKVTAALETLTTSEPPDSAILQTLQRHRIALDRRAAKSGMWLTRLYNIWQIPSPVATHICKNHNRRWHERPLEERLLLVLADVQARRSAWIDLHVDQCVPELASRVWKDECVLPAIPHDEPQSPLMQAILTSSVVFPLLDAFTRYSYFRIPGDGDGPWCFLHKRLMHTAQSDKQTIGYMWSHLLMYGLELLDLCARTTQFAAFDDPDERDRTLIRFLKVVKGASADDAERAHRIRQQYDLYCWHAITGGTLAATVWPPSLLDRADDLYNIYFLHKATAEVGTVGWDDAMKAYNVALEKECAREWTLLQYAALSADESEAAAHALKKLRWIRGMATIGVGINVPLPTKAFISDLYKQLNAVSAAVRWLTRLIDPRADAVVHDTRPQYLDYTHYLLCVLRLSGRFSHIGSTLFASQLYNFIFLNMDLFRTVDHILRCSDLSRADALFTLGSKEWYHIGVEAMRTHRPTMYPPLDILYPEGCTPHMKVEVQAIADGLLSCTPLPPAASTHSPAAAWASAESPVSFDMLSADVLAAHPCLFALRLTDHDWYDLVDCSIPVATRSLAFHLHSVFTIARTWGRDVWRQDAVRFLRTSFLEFLSRRAHPEGDRWVNWDDTILHLLADVDINNAALAPPADPPPASLATTSAPLVFAPESDSIYKHDAESLISLVRSLPSAMAAPKASEAMDSRVADALKSLLKALHFNANRIVYRTLRDPEGSHPWVLPEAANPPALESVPECDDARAYRTIDEYRTRDQASYELFHTSIIQRAARNIGPPPRTVLVNGQAVAATDNWLPQDLPFTILSSADSISNPLATRPSGVGRPTIPARNDVDAHIAPTSCSRVTKERAG